MKIAVISDKGRKRENNEDSYFINKKAISGVSHLPSKSTRAFKR